MDPEGYVGDEALAGWNDPPNDDVNMFADEVTRSDAVSAKEWSEIVSAICEDIVGPDTYNKLESVAGNGIVEVLSRRFGFVLPSEDIVYGSTISGQMSDQELSKNFLRVVMEVLSEPLDQRTRTHIAHFIRNMTSTSTTEIPPACLYDLRASCPSFIGSRHSKLLIERLRCRVQRKIRGEESKTDMKEVYRLSVPGTARLYSLYVLDAATALECLRANLSSTAAIGLYLVKRGFRFYTARGDDCVLDQGTASNFQVDQEGIRAANYKPDHADYLEYQARLLRFLRSPRGPIVYKMGGLYWRIAMSCLSWRDSDVLLGPVGSKDDPSISFVALSNDSESGTEVDDYLTEQEIDLLCGMYRIETGKQNSFLQNNFFDVL